MDSLNRLAPPARLSPVGDAIGDLLLRDGFFLLGGGFWDTFKALFVPGATVAFPSTP